MWLELPVVSAGLIRRAWAHVGQLRVPGTSAFEIADPSLNGRGWRVAAMRDTRNLLKHIGSAERLAGWGRHFEPEGPLRGEEVEA
jgi:hypothetical protein